MGDDDDDDLTNALRKFRPTDPLRLEKLTSALQETDVSRHNVTQIGTSLKPLTTILQ